MTFEEIVTLLKLNPKRVGATSKQLTEIHALLLEVFDEDVTEAIDWLRKDNLAFRCMSPKFMMEDAIGSSVVIRYLKSVALTDLHD